MNPGDTLPTQTYVVTRADLVRYAGASGDFNPIHWSERVATSVGLPGVIAHGMFTMALAARALDTGAGGPGRIRELGCKFTKPVVVPDDGRRTMQWVHVRDVARAAILAATDDQAVGHAYNLASYPPITQIDFVRLLAKVADRPANVVPIPREHLERRGGVRLAPPD